LLNRKQIEENIWNVYIHRCLSHHTYKRTMSSFVKIRMCPWWLITTTSSVCIHVCSIDMRKHVSAIRTTTREKIMNYQWERKRDQRVVTDDTRVLMRQTAILGARLLLLILALVCCARAQLLVLTLNHVLFLLGHDFLPSLSPPSPFFCAYMCMYVLVLRKNEFSDKHVKNDKLPWWASLYMVLRTRKEKLLSFVVVVLP
jgi:hypothetical protein